MEHITRRDPLRVGFVPGVTPGKWETAWVELHRRTKTQHLTLVPVEVDDAERLVRDGELDMVIMRGWAEVDGVHQIPLYKETAVAVVAKDHAAAAFDELELRDLADELDILAEFPDLDLPMAIETAAAGTGYVLVPMSLARLHHRKDVTARPVLDAKKSPVNLVWLVDRDDVDTQNFVGVVRGRRPNSSR
ncbi:DNA-binding transcriptional LysR family regulator [Marmoricola sp. OAE513]|uniref:LysR family transcriptional regulator substrate-binding protein n=1 Tax=Marmoricola sp. OAE513 TaxID=2817894 RepID=UPI001DA655DE